MADDRTTLDPNLGRVVADKYRLDVVAGTGGAGTVYRATHLVLDRPIALKVLNPTLVANPNAKARFRREARAASRLDHVNSVQVFDYGIEPDGLTYLAMELLDGRELYRVIYDDWPLSSERIVKIMSQVLSVLAAAHEIGIVHRDLKPENIMLVTRPGDDGRPTEIVKVADFGIAKTIAGPVTEESLNLTTDGTVHGTPEYMAPEQARGEEIDGRADLYACGMILYEMLVGALPFTGENPFDVILKQLTEPVPIPSEKRPTVDRRFEPVVLKALKKKREERFADAREMRAALMNVLTATASSSEPEGRPTVEASTEFKPRTSLPPTSTAAPQGPNETRTKTAPLHLAQPVVEPLPVVPGHSPVANAVVVLIVLLTLAGGIAGALWLFLGTSQTAPINVPMVDVINTDATVEETSLIDVQQVDVTTVIDATAPSVTPSPRRAPVRRRVVRPVRTRARPAPAAHSR